MKLTGPIKKFPFFKLFENPHAYIDDTSFSYILSCPVLNLRGLLIGSVLKYRHKKQTVYLGVHEGRGRKRSV